MRQLWSRVWSWAAGLAVALGFAASVAHAQQRMVPIPAKAQRADITFNGSADVVVNGQAARLAPGVRIYGRQNMLVMYGALAGKTKAKYILEETTGLVMTVWILTDNEIATPDPKP